MISKKNISSTIHTIYIILSLIACLFCYQSMSDSFIEKPLYLIPLSYGIILFLCQNIRKNFLSLSIIIINTVCLIRFALYPVTLVVENNLFFSIESVYLMIYEIFAVLIFLNIYSRRLQTKQESIVFNKKQIGKLNLVLILITLMLGLLSPSILSTAFNYFEKASGGISGSLSIFFIVGVMVIYVSILIKLSELKGSKEFGFIFALVVAVVYIFLLSYGGDNVHRWKFLSVGLPTMFVLLESFPKYKRIILSTSFVAITLSIFFGTFVKFSVSNVSVEHFLSLFVTSESLDAYFGGLNGITEALSSLRNNVFATSTESTFTDFFGNMPIISQFFNTESHSTHALYLHALGRTDLIIPLLSQSVLHFGVIGAPFMSIIMSIIAIESDRYSKTTKSIYSKFGAITLCVYFSLFMCLSTTILMPQLWTLVIFLVIQYFNEKYFFNKYAINNSTSL